jgi:hypothetical protein
MGGGLDPKDVVRRGYDALDHWLGGDAPMWWSHADAATYRAWIEQAGLPVVAQELVPEGDGGHALFWARRPLELP